MTQPDSKCPYDEDLVVDLLAEGKLSGRQIAAKVPGISFSMVLAISRGAKRRNLHERLSRTIDAAQRRVVRRASGKLADLVDKHIDQGLASNDPEARRCREFVLKTYSPKTIAEPEPPADAKDDDLFSTNNFAKLSLETRGLIMRDIAGPIAPGPDFLYPDEIRAIEAKKAQRDAEESPPAASQAPGQQHGEEEEPVAGSQEPVARDTRGDRV